NGGHVPVAPHGPQPGARADQVVEVRRQPVAPRERADGGGRVALRIDADGDDPEVARLAERRVEVLSDQWADVRTVRVEERDRDPSPAEVRQPNRPAAVVVERE